MGLSSGDRISTKHLAVLHNTMQRTVRTCDGRIDGQTERQTEGTDISLSRVSSMMLDKNLAGGSRVHQTRQYVYGYIDPRGF